MTELLDLNENCLEHVFNYCDAQTIVSLSKVCKRFNAVVTSIHLPKQTKFIADPSIDEEECVEILNCIGQYLIELEIHDAFNSLEFYQVIGRSVGEQIRKFTLFRENMSEELLQTLEPVLQHLDELELHIIEDCNDAMELRARCPNLRRLHIQWNTPFTLTEHWPQLEQFTLGDNEFIGEEQFREFIQNNAQLKKLKIGCFNCDVQLEDIAQYLINLEELTIFQNYSNLSPDSILELQQLTHLKRLILRSVANDFEEIAKNATKLNGLIEIQLQAEFESCMDVEYFEPNPQFLTDIALEMPQIQVFGISYCKLKNETILEFLQTAENLREIHIHSCDFELEADTINAIIEGRKAITEQNGPLIFYTDCYVNDEIRDVNLLFFEDIELWTKIVFIQRFPFFYNFYHCRCFKYQKSGSIFK